jgi:hypothetical protein
MPLIFEWFIVGKLNNQKYFAFKAQCRPEGFEVTGDMNLYIINKLHDLIEEVEEPYFYRKKIIDLNIEKFI